MKLAIMLVLMALLTACQTVNSIPRCTTYAELSTFNETIVEVEGTIETGKASYIHVKECAIMLDSLAEHSFQDFVDGEKVIVLCRVYWLASDDPQVSWFEEPDGTLTGQMLQSYCRPAGMLCLDVIDVRKSHPSLGARAAPIPRLTHAASLRQYDDMIVELAGTLELGKPERLSDEDAAIDLESSKTFAAQNGDSVIVLGRVHTLHSDESATGAITPDGRFNRMQSQNRPAGTCYLEVIDIRSARSTTSSR